MLKWKLTWFHEHNSTWTPTFKGCFAVLLFDVAFLEWETPVLTFFASSAFLWRVERVSVSLLVLFERQVVVGRRRLVVMTRVCSERFEVTATLVHMFAVFLLGLNAVFSTAWNFQQRISLFTQHPFKVDFGLHMVLARQLIAQYVINAVRSGLEVLVGVERQTPEGGKVWENDRVRGGLRVEKREKGLTLSLHHLQADGVANGDLVDDTFEIFPSHCCLHTAEKSPISNKRFQWSVIFFQQIFEKQTLIFSKLTRVTIQNSSLHRVSQSLKSCYILSIAQLCK